MNEPVIRKWIEALRSCKYAQGHNALHPCDRYYCCLGVLCDISGKGKWEHTHWYLGHRTGLPFAVVEWSGLSDKVANDLIHYNDGMKWTFAQIADYLEELLNKKEV